MYAHAECVWREKRSERESKRERERESESEREGERAGEKVCRMCVYTCRQRARENESEREIERARMCVYIPVGIQLLLQCVAVRCIALP